MKLNLLLLNLDKKYMSIFNKQDINVISARNVQEGLMGFKKYHPFLMCIHIDVQRQDSLQLTKEIKSLYPNATIIALVAEKTENIDMLLDKMDFFKIWQVPLNTRDFQKFVKSKKEDRLKRHHKILKKSLEIIAKNDVSIENYLEKESNLYRLLDKLKADKKIFQWIEEILLRFTPIPHEFNDCVEKFVRDKIKQMKK